MNVLIIGSGGREHALLKAIKKSPQVKNIFAVPGNPGMDAIQVPLAVENITEIADFAQKENIALTIVGPEVPLVLGIADEFKSRGLRVMGVNKECAKFEGSKDHTKTFLAKYNIPTAEYVTHTDFESAKKDIGIYGYPMVIKADGLAAGKGVIIAENAEEALVALDDIMVKKVFGDGKVVIEEFLDGIEASIICFVDGKTIIPLETAQDYKRALDGDKGLNTGGMGTYSPSVVIDSDLNKKIFDTILQPTLDGFIADGLDYKGILFVGIMIKNGVPKVLEFNVRFGDPETQVILPRLKTNIIDIFNAIVDGNLAEVNIEWSDEKAVCVVLTAGGYPEAYKKGTPITFDADIDTDILHAGTQKIDGIFATNGGRVLNVVAIADDFETTRQKAYENVKKVHFEGKTFRNDIAKIATTK